MRAAAALFLLLVSAAGAWAQVLRVGDLNAKQIAALDRSKTVVFLQGGMLEEHGPYLPAFTDGILSDRLVREVAAGVVAAKPGWTALIFPAVSVGASGSNELGKQFVFPGTYAIRPSTLRALFMDLASELGEQGFKSIILVHVHGSPLHIGALNDASNYFNETYGGRMVNIWDLLPVLGAWGKAMGEIAEPLKKEDGVSLHGGLDEHSLMLHLQPNLVDPAFRNAKSITGSSYDEAFALAKAPGWPGYLGAPRHATAELGRQVWTAFSSAALATTIEILGGSDLSKYPRYLDYLVKMPLYQEWIRAAEERDSEIDQKQRAWLAARKIKR
jgi:creatinine amidohydrolase/Fe(II)-dependent formamide hydrolase-like protein